ncbi:MAG TPA: DUF255 domain-containing protein [Bacteroidetes bacterium]|nr:DUF255 domain-containing protein [Bacteroidota bacterium]
MKTNSILLLFIPIILLLSCKTSKNTSDNTSKQYRQKDNIQFYYGGTLTEVIDRAADEGKIVFLDMTADWCAPCKMMEDEVYTYQPLYEFMNENFVSYRLDIEKENGPNIAFLYNVKSLPTILFLDTKGRTLVKKVGSVDITTFMNLAKKALNKAKE